MQPQAEHHDNARGWTGRETGQERQDMDGGAARRIGAVPSLVAAACAIGGGEPAGASADGWPGWVPAAARDYIAHVEEGRTIRAIAREAQVHPSTILRRVRRIEASRDDPLVDEALRRLSSRGVIPLRPRPKAAPEPAPQAEPVAAASLEARALPLLRRLSEPATLLAVARDMENGVILREAPGGAPQRLAVVPRTLAEAMALQGWIACADPEARIRRYGIAAAGRSLLRRATSEAARELAAAEEDEDSRLRHMRSLLAESPLTALARRRDGEGKPFLSRDLVAAGERLREDVEMAAQGLPGLDWEAVLLAPEEHAAATEGPQHRPEAALGRVCRALLALGPGLADVALRCCGMLEGIESLERRLGWSARSGKVVLRIALNRLLRHHLEEESRGSSMIG